ncbi:MAG: FtsX-like permease family protein [bacterium]
MRGTLIFSQAVHKWLVTVLLFLALTASVSLYVYISNTTRYTNRSMQLIVKRLGHNLIILPDSTDPLDVYWCTNKQAVFSENIAVRIADHVELASRYFVSVLQTRLVRAEKTFLLTGIDVVQRSDETAEKGNIIRPVPERHVRLGAMTAKWLGRVTGDTLHINGTAFKIKSILKEKGDEDDYRIFLPLKTLQSMLGREGKIHYLMAFLCQHGSDVEKTIKNERAMLKNLVPGMTLVTKGGLIQGRALARLTTNRTLYYLLGLILVVTIMIIIISGAQEVAERRMESGILAAMGAGHGYILSLYFIKIGLLAVLASFTGFILGSSLAVHWTSGFLVTETSAVAFQWLDLPKIGLITLATSLLAESIPLIGLVRSDPSDVLME